MLVSASLLRVSNLAKAKHRGKAELFRGAWTDQRNHRQACLQASPYCECPIWRKPNTEEKRSFFEVAWTEKRKNQYSPPFNDAYHVWLFIFKKYCIYLYFVILYPHNEWTHKENEMDKKERIEKQIGTLKGIREMLDMNRTEFSRYMDIPLRTLEEWEAGRRQMPEYVLRLIAYYVKVQKLMKEKGIELEERYEQK